MVQRCWTQRSRRRGYRRALLPDRQVRRGGGDYDFPRARAEAVNFGLSLTVGLTESPGHSWPEPKNSILPRESNGIRPQMSPVWTSLAPIIGAVDQKLMISPSACPEPTAGPSDRAGFIEAPQIGPVILGVSTGAAEKGHQEGRKKKLDVHEGAGCDPRSFHRCRVAAKTKCPIARLLNATISMKASLDG